MDTTYGMSADSYRGHNRWHWIIGLLLLALLFLLPLLFNIGPSSWRACLPSPSADVGVTLAPVEPVAPPAEVIEPQLPVAEVPEPEVAAVVEPEVVAAPLPVEPAVPADLPVARVYFGLDRFDEPKDIDATLAEVVAYLKAHPEAVALISGFHDPQGNLAHNQTLSFNRAKTVEAAIVRQGIPEERLDKEKPQQTTGTGSHREARRVEVSIKPATAP